MEETIERQGAGRRDLSRLRGSRASAQCERRNQHAEQNRNGNVSLRQSEPASFFEESWFVCYWMCARIEVLTENSNERRTRLTVSMSGSELPDAAHTVAVKNDLVAEDRNVLSSSLRCQHTGEWIAMRNRQKPGANSVLDRDQQGLAME
jgi:hypothetical protein